MTLLGERTEGGRLRAEHAGETVRLLGWIQRRRDHGGVIFADVRDRSGLVQAVFNPDMPGEGFARAERLRSEYVVSIRGRVRLRPEGSENGSLATGEVEVVAESLDILNRAKTPPFYIEDDLDVDETLRLKYRYLDLRRPEMQEILMIRHRVTQIMRNFFDAHGFLEIETPMLIKSSPEGARDYLVPSRVHPGEFYALPQSPQIFKQLLMVSGLEKYFQIVRCFRDEDLRADRQPEFTQLDVEMSFVEPEDILPLMEELIALIFAGTTDRQIKTPFPRLTYREGMERFGSDKPDIRFGLELIEVGDLVAETEFKVFANAVAKGGRVKGLCAKGAAGLPRREIDGLVEFVRTFGAKGLAYIVLTQEGVKSPIAKFFTQEQLQALLKRMGGKTGDILFFVADKEQVVFDALGHLRLELGRRLNLIPAGVLNFLWVTEFPLLEYDESEKRYVAIHHPFTSPMEEDLPLLATAPQSVRAKAYDLVLNGVELGGGSIRIHRREVQERMFQLLGLSREDAESKFGYLLEAFEYGTPPHGGIAFGLDRLIMLLTGKDNIRDVIAFPKTQSAADLMSQAPSAVSAKQLNELHLKTDIVRAKIG
ncbi:Aspartyl-tRNA synthetase signature [Acididesulfobacillus acetoxydans]|uniref:Aspartate--tRNA(Asp/Asn) ligase n=1 Tax=Acididesulfobacillus acetoxydans TaxID=1561005 RepID=A0A8S0WGA1_9FIRM|nr:aspartate--tRNA ligase [Acididesulfobacillus acetoxydans]CAA7601712.1 Aspartyl-tRNA synthetase signature [Acididesulfobacillus acetoxydans]CEJ09069.1 Aspartate--tRNA ligase [Acididesulfobacillus acetoxydans]